MKLAYFPPEVLDLVTVHLPGESVARLWFSGSVVLQRKMIEGGVTSLNFEFGQKRHSAAKFPSFCSFLSKLVSFRWILASHHSNARFSIQSLSILPRNLRILRVNRTLNFKQNQKSEMSFMDTLSQLFPNLTTVEATEFIGDSVNILPDSITNLTVLSSDRLCFGPRLTSLSVGMGGTMPWSRDPDDFKLPRAVRELFSDPSICANLTHFSRKLSVGEISVDCWDLFPRSLTSLHLVASSLLTSEHALHLPLGLRSFSLRYESRHDHAVYDEKTLESLPRSIEHLKFTERYGFWEFSGIPLPAIAKLPPGLKFLAAAFAIVYPEEIDPQDADDLAQWKSVRFPPLLHTLKTPTPIPCSILPKSLTHLHSGVHKVDSMSTLVLPPLLVTLKLSIPYPDHVDLSSLANMRQLLHLSLSIGYCSNGPLNPFWPNSLVTLEINRNAQDLDLINLGPNRYGDWEKDWVDAIPPNCHTLEWTCGRVCPVFQIPSSAPDRFNLPSSIVKLSIICQNSHFFNYLPRNLKYLDFVPLEPLDPLHFEHLPKSLESLYVFGSSKELIPEHIQLLPYNLSILRLRLPSLPDVVKAAATASGVHLLRVQS